MKFYALLATTVFLFSSAVPAEDIISGTTVADSGFSSSGYHVGVGYASSDGRFTNEAAAQKFIAGESGLVTTVTASVDPTRGGEPLKVSIFTSSNGVPGTNLGTVEVSEEGMSNFSTSDWEMNTFDLSSLDIELVAGNSYFMVFRTDTAILSSSRYRAVRVAVNENSVGSSAMYSEDGGVTWKSSSSAPEIGVIVRVADSVPPPVDANIAFLSGSIKMNGKPKPFSVAVLTSENLNAFDVDPASILIGDPVLTDPETGSGEPGPASQAYLEDVDGDGSPDLVLEFNTAELLELGAIDSTTNLLLLDGLTYEGGVIYGLTEVSSKGKGKGNGKGKGKSKR